MSNFKPIYLTGDEPTYAAGCDSCGRHACLAVYPEVKEVFGQEVSSPQLCDTCAAEVAEEAGEELGE